MNTPALKKCFISYAHEELDRDTFDYIISELKASLGSRAEVNLDQDLPYGEDLRVFMSQIESADLAIIFLTPAYKRKVENRSGGVFEEFRRLLIRLAEQPSNPIKAAEGRPKLVPIILSGDFEKSVPSQLKNRLCLDLSSLIAVRQPSGVHVPTESANRLRKALAKISLDLLGSPKPAPLFPSLPSSLTASLPPRRRLVRDLVNEDFVLVRSEWPAPEADALIRALKPGWVIVESPGPAYHVLSRWETLDGLSRGGADGSTGEALRLAGQTPVPVLDAYAVAENLPEICVVLDGGSILGFYDAEEGPNHLRGAGDLQRQELAHRLVADFPPTFAPGQTVSLLASLETDLDHEPRLELETKIDLLARASGVLQIEGSTEAPLIFDGAEKSRPVRFRVTATEAGGGHAEIYAMQGEQSLGDLTFSATVQESSTGSSPKKQEIILSRISVKSADLTLIVQEHYQDGQRGFRLWLTADAADLGLNMHPTEPVLFQMEPRVYLQDLFKDIEQVRRGRIEEEERMSALGESFFERLVPRDVRNLLWLQRHRLRSVHILSQVPWIPWELCKLNGPGENGIESGEFLCESFAVSRWPLGKARKPVLRLGQIAVIQPEDSGLGNAADEREFLLSLAGDRRKVEVILPDYVKVRQALASGLHDGIHFVGHGLFRGGERSAITLNATERQELRPQDLTGRVANLAKASPFVFLNSCQAGQTNYALTGTGGWAQSFLDAGAAAFLGPYWQVQDEPASRFAKTLYPKLLQGDLSIGEAVRQTRLEMRQRNPGDPTRLAYTLFADPQAKVLG
jgi:CHAT domain/TIR domain